MQKAWISILILIAIVNLGFFVVFASGGNSFENPMQPLSSTDRLVNANRTGEKVPGWENYDRSLDTQLVHTGFAKNTNSCASCHMTHTAQGKGYNLESHIVSGQSLLFQSSLYNTCMSCHDGSLPSAYNMLAGTTPSGSLTPGGKFSEDLLPDNSVSYHLSSGARIHGNAPGALSGADTSARYTRRGVKVEGDWDRPLTCASCHGAHGTYSSRHLLYNPNGRAMRADRQINAPLVLLSDGHYGLHSDYGHLVPWLYYQDETLQEVSVAVYTSGGTEITEQFFVNYAKGELTRVSGTDPPASVSFTLATVVGLDIVNLYSTTDPESVTYRSGVTDFCVSCHIGFHDNPEAETFAWHDRFYHLNNVDASLLLSAAQADNLALEERDGGLYVNCLTCHFGHGTDYSRMLRRDAGWESLGQLTGFAAPLEGMENTVNLRFFNPDNNDGYGGRFEACYLCHGEFRYNPKIESTYPAANSEVVAGELQSVELYLYDKDMVLDSETINTVTVSVYDGDTYISGDVAYDDLQGKITFTPSSWQAGRQYTVTVTDGIKSRIGGSMEMYTFSFHTYLEVSNVSPTGTNVSQNSEITTGMSADVDANTVTAESGTFTVSYLNGENIVYIAGDRTVAGSVITFTPLEPLPAGTEITVTLTGGIGGIRGVSGASMSGNYQWSFTTESPPG